MVRFGKLFRKNYGEKPPASLGRGRITYAKPQRQVSLDTALKRANTQMKIAKQSKGQKRAKALSIARKILSQVERLE